MKDKNLKKLYARVLAGKMPQSEGQVKWLSFLNDIRELSKYMEATSGSCYVPIKAVTSTYRPLHPGVEKIGVFIGVVPRFDDNGCFDDLYIMAEYQGSIKDFFIENQAGLVLPTRYIMRGPNANDFYTYGAANPEHKANVIEQMLHVYENWEEYYKEGTKAMIGDRMEEYLDEHEERE